MAATARRVFVTAVFGCGLTLALACSSVPDVHFVDGGDPGTSSSSGSEGGAGEGGPPPPDWSCPNKPPPAGSGVCCGNRLCLKCTAADCTKCEQAGCAGTLNAACCPKNPVQLQCRSYTDC